MNDDKADKIQAVNNRFLAKSHRIHRTHPSFLLLYR